MKLGCAARARMVEPIYYEGLEIAVPQPSSLASVRRLPAALRGPAIGDGMTPRVMVGAKPNEKQTFIHDHAATPA
jgi:hypothetical protein